MIKSSTIFYLLIFVPLIIVMVGMMLSVARRLFVGPLEVLIKGAKIIGSGNLEYRIQARGKGEVARLAASINKMAADLKEQQLTTQIERDRTKKIVDRLNVGVIMLDGQRRVVLANPQTREFLGTGRDNLARLCQLKVKRVRQDFVVTEPEERSLEISTIPIPPRPGQRERLLVVIYDVTRERQIERMKSEFISIASHQLRTPLSAIKWTLKMLTNGEMGELKSEQQLYLEKAYDSNERMIALVNDLLDVSRIEEGRLLFNFSDFDVKALLGDLIEQHRVLFDQNHLTIDIHTVKGKPLIVWGDPERLSLAFNNLIDNAIKFTPAKKSITISVESNKSLLTVTVADEGIGISAADQKKLCTKFFRAENAKKLQTQGTGLGLFIARNIIEKHHGSLTVKSRLGHGAKFICQLPLKKTSEEKN